MKKLERKDLSEARYGPTDPHQIAKIAANNDIEFLPVTESE